MAANPAQVPRPGSTIHHGCRLSDKVTKALKVTGLYHRAKTVKGEAKMRLESP